MIPRPPRRLIVRATVIALALGLASCVHWRTSTPFSPAKTSQTTTHPLTTLLWRCRDLPGRPRAVCYDDDSKDFFVTCAPAHSDYRPDAGCIARVYGDGRRVTKDWYTGLIDPRALTIDSGAIYAIDHDRLLRVDIATARLEHSWQSPGGVPLDDVTVTPIGVVFVSSAEASAVYQLANDRLEPWIDRYPLEGARGLVSEDLFLVLTADSSLYRVDYGKREVVRFSKSPHVLHDVASDHHGGYFASDWRAGCVWYVSPSGHSRVACTVTLPLGITYDTDCDRIIVVERDALSAYSIQR